jgi:hypothetical protein
MANDEELAPYFERAKTSSGVRWVAIRARVDYLLSSLINNEEKESAPSAPSEGSSKNAAAAGSQEAASPEANDIYTIVDAPGDTRKHDAQADGRKKEQGEDQRSEPPAQDHAA